MSVRNRLRLRSHAFGSFVREALCGYAFVTTKTRSRWPAIASPTTSSAPPSPYISAVSINVMPRSIPKRSAAISSSRVLFFSPIRQVPWPSAGTRVPLGSDTVFIYRKRRTLNSPSQGYGGGRDEPPQEIGGRGG